MHEKNLLNRLLLKLPSNIRLFRNNIGKGWVGKLCGSRIIEGRGRVVVLEQARVLNSGLTKGSSDLIGWTTIEITADMVGKKVSVFTALEAKVGRTRTSKEQKNFIEKVQESGGIASIFKSDLEGITTITEWTFKN